MWRGWDGGWGEQGTGRTGSITAEYPDPSEGRLVHSQAGKKARGETTPWLRAAWAKYNRHHPPLIINNPSCILRDTSIEHRARKRSVFEKKKGEGGTVLPTTSAFPPTSPSNPVPCSRLFAIVSHGQALSPIGAIYLPRSKRPSRAPRRGRARHRSVSCRSLDEREREIDSVIGREILRASGESGRKVEFERVGME